MAERFLYIRKDYEGLLSMIREWILFDGARGCTPIGIEGVGLAMNKAPVRLAELEPPPPPTTRQQAPSKPSGPAPEPLTKAVESPPKTDEEKRRAKARALPAFDLYDMPEAMRAEGFAIGAKFAKRWLDGRKYSAYITDPKTGKPVEGRYDTDMIDTDSVKLRWLLRYWKVRKKYDALISTLATPLALDALKGKPGVFTKFLEAAPSFSGTLDTLDYCGGDLQRLHKEFQFQLSRVNMLDGLVDTKLSNATKYAKFLGMSDVSASLGNFYFYAAVAKARIDKKEFNRYNTPHGTLICRHDQVTVTHIFVYARDSYSFHDSRKASQYLGHWNKNGLVILPYAMATHLVMSAVPEGSKLDQPIEVDDNIMIPMLIRNNIAEKYVFYPIRNRDYREWQTKHGRGGDFLIFSDLKLIKLEHPIHLDMGEVCRVKQ